MASGGLSASGNQLPDIDPHIVLAQHLFILKGTAADPSGVPSTVDKPALKAAVLKGLVDGNKAPLYVRVCTELGQVPDAAHLAGMRAKNDAELVRLDAIVADAEANLGESEVREALLARAVYLMEIGDFDRGEMALTVAEAKTVALSHKLDIAFRRLRVAFFLGDQRVVATRLTAAHALLATGGDWEGKNRLKARRIGCPMNYRLGGVHALLRAASVYAVAIV